MTDEASLVLGDFFLFMFVVLLIKRLFCRRAGNDETTVIH